MVQGPCRQLRSRAHRVLLQFRITYRLKQAEGFGYPIHERCPVIPRPPVFPELAGPASPHVLGGDALRHMLLQRSKLLWLEYLPLAEEAGDEEVDEEEEEEDEEAKEEEGCVEGCGGVQGVAGIDPSGDGVPGTAGDDGVGRHNRRCGN